MNKVFLKQLFTWATCGRPISSIFLSIYLSCRVWENYPEVLAYSFLHGAWGLLKLNMSSSELLVVFSFAEKAFNQNSKRLSNQALLRLRRVSNSFFKFSKRCLPMNSLRRTWRLFATSKWDYFPCNYRKYCTKAGKNVVLCFTAKTSLLWAVCVTRVCCRRAAKCCII